MIERLTATTSADLDHIGGKGGGLVRLLAAGLDVPEAWVILAPVSLTQQARSQLLTTQLATWWREVSEQHPHDAWAVRSSAVAEDLEGASFAGVYETILGVTSLEQLVGAVRRCWGGLEQDRASTYLATQGMGTQAGIAVVLQRMIRPRVSGVMLTENPLAPFADEVVIDASYGLGEAIVSGRTHPDHIVLDRSGTILRTVLGAKEVALEHEHGRADLVELSVPLEDRQVRCLDDADIDRLHDLADRVGAAIGERRDLEWAMEDERLFVLQDRPITGLPPREPREVWTRRFGDEYLSDYMTPLGTDLMLPWLTQVQMDEVASLQKRPEIMRIDKLRRIDGHVYLNAAYALELARAMPPEDRDTSLTPWFDTTIADRVRAVPFEPRLLVGMLLTARKDRGRGSLRANLRALAAHCETIDATVAPWRGQDLTTVSREEWLRQFRVVDELGRNHFRIIRWGMAQHGPILQALLSNVGRNWGERVSPETMQSLISGLPGTHTATINRDIWRLGGVARQDGAVLAGLRSDVPLDELRAGTADAAFWAAFDDFLIRHGHRSSSREVSALRWHEQPDLVLGLVRAQVHSEAPAADPSQLEERAGQRRIEAEQTLLRSVGRGPKRAIVRMLLSLTQQYTVYRENQRYHLDYLLNHLHVLTHEQGRRFAERGDLPAAEDVYLLSGDRFWQLVARDEPLSDPSLPLEIERARADRERFGHRLPATFWFDGVPTEGVVEAPDEIVDGAIPGLGASAGRVRGVVRNVPDLAQLSTVRTGEILVTSNIDPGWTSVFPMIGGLVTETGGVLCHGAILAREYGIPTVTSVSGASSMLTTGMVVEVDGTNGTVTVLDEADTAPTAA